MNRSQNLSSPELEPFALNTLAFLATQLQCSDQRYRYPLNVPLSTVLVQILNTVFARVICALFFPYFGR